MTALETLGHLTMISNLSRTLAMARLQANAFTRKRKMSFPEALAFLLDMRKTTLQTRLNLFFGQVKDQLSKVNRF